ncbi:hypothetical protein [Aquisalinus flavus]|uniref:Uncharacterized protein n=1 Tax=Aquisalinus flavus TaxID=1526572 RepID=A0A8J2V282_9PROT|nr:hypothetical protein [Aquisalinus flavus]MBD0427131.1 hypothetical protein [Aquisalinus flavus]UNE46951.1 hypothetical protein FF099_02210 [Aquisalinus flavus]GGC98613.1 hypothetical protein GCM10011342_04440 [Aquisalinus flavus]
MTRLLLAGAAAIALVAACSGDRDEADADPRATQADPVQMQERAADDSTGPDDPSPGTASSNTQGGDGSDLVLSPLTRADMHSLTLQGELGCAFTQAGGAAPLFIGMGFAGVDERSQGMVKIGDVVERLTASTADGFDGMRRGTTFAGRGLTVTIDPTSPDRAAHEGTDQDATLTAMRGDGAQRSWSGDWTCGP